MKLLSGLVRFRVASIAIIGLQKLAVTQVTKKDPISVNARFEDNSERYSNPWGGELRGYAKKDCMPYLF